MPDLSLGRMETGFNSSGQPAKLVYYLATLVYYWATLVYYYTLLLRASWKRSKLCKSYADIIRIIAFKQTSVHLIVRRLKDSLYYWDIQIVVLYLDDFEIPYHPRLVRKHNCFGARKHNINVQYCCKYGIYTFLYIRLFTFAWSRLGH